MMIHKDGKTNLVQMDATSAEATEWIRKQKITKVLMNPPYERRYGCATIVGNVLDSVPAGTKCAFILPDKKMEKESKLKALLERHTLTTIIKLPENLCVTRKLTDKEYEDALAEKLQEEVKELLEAYTAKERSVLDCAEEMADVMEVMYAMGKTCAVSKREIEQVRSQKAAEKGTFSKKIFLVSTEK